jgi:hypothetical protein
MMNNTYFKHLAVTGVAGGTRPRGNLALIHDSQPQAMRHRRRPVSLRTLTFTKTYRRQMR